MNITKILPLLLYNYAMNHTFHRLLSANKSTQDVGGARENFVDHEAQLSGFHI